MLFHNEPSETQNTWNDILHKQVSLICDSELSFFLTNEENKLFKTNSFFLCENVKT